MKKICNLYFFQRVYVDEWDYDLPTPKFPRSISFPDLRELIYGGLEIPEPPHPRRRANSEVAPMVRLKKKCFLS